MKNYDCEVVIKPSNEGKIRLFVKGGEPFVANIDNVISTEHYVTLGSREHRTLLGSYKYKAGLCEHFMANLAASSKRVADGLRLIRLKTPDAFSAIVCDIDVSPSLPNV